ncbi:MAG: hypothetical protein CM15mP42_12070 [Methanobacteriota archaeon]|nr:MAG: hypothetical protein CM15mP42_12070 [Euryarchaeota archaeon]
MAFDFSRSFHNIPSVVVSVNEIDIAAFLILFLGIVILTYPLFLLIFQKATEKKSNDLLIGGILLLLSVAFLIALWAIYFASTSPHLLWPLAIFTLIFRFVSPLIFVRVLKGWRSSEGKLTTPSTKIIVEAFPGFGMVLGTFIILSPYFDSNNSENLELLIATAFAIFSFSQFYLYLFIDYIRKDSLAFAWVAGFLIGVGLMVMVPYYLDGFDSAFRFTSAAGWFAGSFIMMYGDKEPYSEYLRKMGW